MDKLLSLFLLAAAPAPVHTPAAAEEETETPVEQLIAAALPAKIVMAKAETAPVATIDDAADDPAIWVRSEEHTSELQSHHEHVCRLLLEKIHVTTTQLPTV